jgi:hypothetical protein
MCQSSKWLSDVFLGRCPGSMSYLTPATTFFRVLRYSFVQTAAGDLIPGRPKVGEKVFDLEKSLNRTILNAAEQLDVMSTLVDGVKTFDIGNLSVRSKAVGLLEVVHRLRTAHDGSITTFAKGTHWFRHLPQHLRSGESLDDLLVSVNGDGPRTVINVGSLVEFTTEIISAMIQAEAWAIRDARHKKSRTLQQDAAQA